ncbi:class D beta-lactamase [Anaerosporobacter faecicola]|uniref:class D beta-lactamase n=1 Tax=Anaerosporobacter faecicola TaxID=2718714 RepID=UPI0014394F47|nr:class D beta-lactamase [Anaerosporobacter faecicola]
MKRRKWSILFLALLVTVLVGCSDNRAKEKETKHVEISSDETNTETNIETNTETNTAEVNTESMEEVQEVQSVTPTTKEDEKTEPTYVEVDYSSYFEGVNGCAVIYDTEKNQEYQVYNKDMCMTRVSPFSTFKIISTLIGLNNTILNNVESTMGYDGTKYPVKQWNADLSLKEAFQSSCVWYFKKVIDQAGQDIVEKEVKNLGYGNCDCTEWAGSGINPMEDTNGFWLASSLKISPLEQVDVLRAIVEGKTIYSKEDVTILKEIMETTMSNGDIIYGKTGHGLSGENWFVGFANKDNRLIYFAVYVADDLLKNETKNRAKGIAEKLMIEVSNKL